MKHLLIVLLLIVSVPVCGSAQGVLNRLKDKVKNRVDQRVDEGMERGLDKAEEEIEGKGKSGSKGTVPEKVEEKSAAGKEGPVSFKSYSRYDFVPGDHILYAEDFAQDVVGEFPLKWATNNRGEVVTVRGSENKWLRMFHGGHFVSPGLQQLPENFTIEFDLIMDFGKEENGYVYPDVQFKLLNLPSADAKAKDYLLNPDAGVELLFTLAPGEEESSTISLQSQRGGMEVFHLSCFSC